MNRFYKKIVFPTLIYVFILGVFHGGHAATGVVQQPLVAGPSSVLSGQRTQEEFGLLTLRTPGGSCSASMLNDYWAITAAHCVFTPFGCPATGACQQYQPNQISLSANWVSNSKTVQVLRIIPYSTGPWRPTDIALLQVGLHDFGRPDQPQRVLYDKRPMANLTVKTFGRGINRLAFMDANNKPQASFSDNSYRSADFAISSINPNSSALPEIYSFAGKNGSILAGGDSGGPSYLQDWDNPLSTQRKLQWKLMGIHSTCDNTGGCLAGQSCPANDPWTWTAAIKQCSDASVLPVRNSILANIEAIPQEQNFVGTFGPMPANYQPIWLYAIKDNGDLIWYRKDGKASNWMGPRRVGNGWGGFKDVIPAGGNRFYGLAKDGKLLWFQHQGFNDGSFNWKGPVQVGVGWGGFKQIFSGGDGIIYAIQSDGKLVWYRDLAFENGGGLQWWEGPKTVGTGWGAFKQVFSMGEGVMYAIKDDGTLLWYRHDGYKDGVSNWANSFTVGSQWHQFKTVVPVGNGGILAVASNGDLYFYEHKNYLEGKTLTVTGSGLARRVRFLAQWEGPFKIGNGWQGFQDIIGLIPQTIITPPH